MDRLIQSLCLRRSELTNLKETTQDSAAVKMVLQIYFDPLSQPSRALLLFCKANSIPFEGKHISIREGEHRTDEFAKINPFQKLPVINHGGFLLTESVAILRYLCRTFPVSENWYPRKSSSRIALIDEYMAWQHVNLRSNCALYFITHFIPIMFTGKFPDSIKVTRSKRAMEVSLDQVENIWLKGKLFIAGNDITIADLLAVTEMEQPGIVGYDVCKDRPALAAYMERVKTRLNPYYDEVHSSVYELREKYLEEFNKLSIHTEKSKI